MTSPVVLPQCSGLKAPALPGTRLFLSVKAFLEGFLSDDCTTRSISTVSLYFSASIAQMQSPHVFAKTFWTSS